MRMKWLEEYKCWVFDDGSIATPAKTGLTVHKTHKTRGGYMRVWLRRKGPHTNVSVHRALALAFIPNPENKPFVDHIDRNKENNQLSSLRWATVSENTLNSAASDRCIERFGVHTTDPRYTAEYYKTHKEKAKKSVYEWREANREHYNAYMREYKAGRRASNG